MIVDAPDERAWLYPSVVKQLESLGYVFIGLIGADDVVDMEWARGDMADADLDWLQGALPRVSQVFWHAAARSYAEVSGWLDDQPVLNLRTDFPDGSMLRTRQLLKRMPTWRTRYESASDYLSMGHDPEGGVFVQVLDVALPELHAAHAAELLRVEAQPGVQASEVGAMQAYVRGSNRLLNSAVLQAQARTLNTVLWGAVGLVSGVGSLLLGLLTSGWLHTMGLVLGAASVGLLALVFNRPGWLPRVIRSGDVED